MLKALFVCYSNLQSVIITCTYDLWVASKSIHQSKPHIQVTNTHGNIALLLLISTLVMNSHGSWCASKPTPTHVHIAYMPPFLPHTRTHARTRHVGMHTKWCEWPIDNFCSHLRVLKWRILLASLGNLHDGLEAKQRVSSNSSPCCR
jgi:hypothetical protein